MGGVKLTWFGIGLAVAFVMASFVIWRRMRADYAEEDILTFTVFLAVVTLLASLGWKWWSIGGVLVTVWVSVFLWMRKQSWDFWEWLDTLLPVSLAVGFIAVLAWGRDYWVAAVLLGLGWAAIMGIKKIYRSFAWYTSGRMGFVGIVGIMWWAIVWMLIAKWQPSNVYWGGLKLEQWMGMWIIVASLVAIYLRGGRKVTHDWKKFLHLWQKKRPANY